MLASHSVPVAATPPAQCGGQSAVAEDNSRDGAFEWSLFVLFALLLAMVAFRHQLWNDEMQAWLIARDNHSLFDLFHALRYEGHPAFWYLVLYIPAHMSWNPVSMEVINYLFAVAEAWLVLSARRLHWPLRVLIVFSFYVFSYYGGLARSYMLTMLLLTAATRCLLGERQHRKLAILLLALAMNTHILAVPVAGAIALWAFCFAKLDSWKKSGRIFLDSEFRIALVVLLASLATAYLTVRMPADINVPIWPEGRHSMAFNILQSEERAWKAFLPARPESMPASVRGWLDPDNHLSLPAIGLSLILMILIAGALRTSQARTFFLTAATLLLIAMGITVKDPDLRHLGMLFTVFVLALMIDAYTVSGKAGRLRLPQTLASVVVLAILAFQTLTGIYYTTSILTHPKYAAGDVASWLKQQGLDRNPLVFGGHWTTPVIGYVERPSTYVVSCKCFGSYVVFNTKFDSYRIVSLEDLKTSRGSAPLPVILIQSNPKLDPAYAQKLGLVEIHSFVARGEDLQGSYTLYEQKNP
jgi:hypothetical protein